MRTCRFRKCRLVLRTRSLWRTAGGCVRFVGGLNISASSTLGSKICCRRAVVGDRRCIVASDRRLHTDWFVPRTITPRLGFSIWIDNLRQRLLLCRELIGCSGNKSPSRHFRMKSGIPFTGLTKSIAGPKDSGGCTESIRWRNLRIR
jgi:hypothetical protein